MPAKNTPNSISKVESDPRLFMVFMTLVIVSMYVVTLVNIPTTRQLTTLIPFTVLLIVHVVLHWNLEKITQRSKQVLWYIVSQGALALVISWLSGNIGMPSALFMALIGEAVGLLGITRQSFLAGIYYMVLLALALLQVSGWASSGLFIVGTIPMVIFVIIYVTLYMRQSDAREQAQALATELESANRQLAEYAAQVEDLTIANERQRMARELHDTLSQGLAGLILQLEAADAHLGRERIDKAHAIIIDAMSQARVTLADARRAIDDLRQSNFDDLDSALRLEIDSFTHATGIPVQFHLEQMPSLPDLVKETIARVLTESLTNIVNHAHAQQVSVKIGEQDQQLMLSIQDDGVGFDPGAIPSGHYGILGIQERVRLAHGSVEIQSENGKGTLLKVQIPL